METWACSIPVAQDPGKHHEQVMNAFVKSIREGTPLVAEGVEGVRGLELGNAMLMAGLTRTPVELPMDGDAFDNFIKELIAKYGGKKTLAGSSAGAEEMAASFR